MIFQPSINIAATASDWVRPADWLPIDHLISPGDQGIVGLFAVFPNTQDLYHNRVALSIRTGYYVDWGDGTAETLYGDSAVAEHEFDYDSISDSTLTSRGYKQVIIKVRAQTPNTTNSMNQVYINYNHSGATKAFEGYNWLDIRMCFVNLTNYFGTRYNSNPNMVRMPLLEKMYIYQNTTRLVYLMNVAYGAPNLAHFDAEGLDTSNMTNLGYAFVGCKNIKYFGITSWNTGNLGTLEGTFMDSDWNHLDLSNFISNVGVSIDCTQAFYGVRAEKISLGSIRVGILTNMFYGCNAAEIDNSQILHNNDSMTLANFLYGTDIHTGRLKSFDFSKFDVSKCSNITNLISLQRNIEEVIFTTGSFNYINVSTAAATIVYGTAGYNSLKKIRLPGLSVSFTMANTFIDGTNMNLLFGDLWNCNGNIAQSGVTLGTNKGLGYALNDIITITGGNNDAQLYVAAIGTGGAITSVGWVNGNSYRPSRGTGYTIANNYETTTNRSGTGFQINITSLIAPQIINISNTPAATDPITDRAIAIAKNWTVVG